MTRREFPFFACAGILLLTAVAQLPVRAQDREDAAAAAHITSVKGQVSVRHGDSGVWARGMAGAPLTADDQITTATKGAVEMQLDPAKRLQAAGNTELRLAQAESGRYRIQVIRGAVRYRVVGASTANARFETPSVSVRPSAEGMYRIRINDAGESEIAVSKGNVEVAGPSGSQWIYAGQKMVARGPATDPEFRIERAISRWKRVALIVANVVQFADVVSSISVGGGGEPTTASASKGSAAKPSAGSGSSTPPRSSVARAGR